MDNYLVLSIKEKEQERRRGMKIMPSFLLVFIVLFFLFIEPKSAAGRETRRREINSSNEKKKKVALFVFGDSYADTGNWEKSTWKSPYGMTYPGKPSGRSSDGRILTDFIAEYMGIEIQGRGRGREPVAVAVPVPYEQRNEKKNKNKDRFGMNFAYGGSGVFDTSVPKPNMSAQIRLFKGILDTDRHHHHQHSSVVAVLVSLAGNDYANYLRVGSGKQTLKQFARSVVAQLVLNLKEIKRVLGGGVSRTVIIMVTGLDPLGCLPTLTMFNSYTNCSDTINRVVSYHNRLLTAQIQRLNRHHHHHHLHTSTPTPTSASASAQPIFFMLDLYGAFIKAINNSSSSTTTTTEEKPLKPCCLGTSVEYGCGSTQEVDYKDKDKGLGNHGFINKYTVCSHPDRAFFWDAVHPTQAGWSKVFSALKPSLPRFIA